MSMMNNGALFTQMCRMALQRQNDQWGSLVSGTSDSQTGSVGFADILRQVSGGTITDNETYLEHLKSKYENVRLETVGRDQKSIDKVAGTMSGSDVIIAPKMLDKMANDQELAAKIEGYIDKAIAKIPQDVAWCAARGLVFDFDGIIVHEDGTVTEICGCSDSPERVAEVDRINKEKREKEAEERKRIYEYGREMAALRTRYYEESQVRAAAQEQMMSEQYASSILAYNSLAQTLLGSVNANTFSSLAASGRSGSKANSAINNPNMQKLASFTNNKVTGYNGYRRYSEYMDQVLNFPNNKFTR